MSRKKLVGVLKNLLFLCIGITLLYLAFRGKDLNLLLEDLRTANYTWVGLSLFFAAVAYWSRAARWLILLEPMGYMPRLSSSIYAIMIGYFANLAIPRIGELTRCTILNQSEDVPVNKLFGTVILERVIDLFLLLSLTLITILLQFDVFGHFFMEMFREKAAANPNLVNTLITFSLIAGVVLIALLLTKNKLKKYSLAMKIRDFWYGIKEGFKTIGRIKKKRWFILHTALIWSCYYLMAYVCFFAIEPTAHLSPVDGLFILVVGGFGMSAPVQGGIGAYHIFVSSALVLLGVANASALSYATIVHTSQTLLVLLAGAISLLLLYLARQKPVTLTS